MAKTDIERPRGFADKDLANCRPYFTDIRYRKSGKGGLVIGDSLSHNYWYSTLSVKFRCQKTSMIYAKFIVQKDS